MAFLRSYFGYGGSEEKKDCIRDDDAMSITTVGTDYGEDLENRGRFESSMHRDLMRNAKDDQKVYLRVLPRDVSADMIRKELGRYGNVIDVHIPPVRRGQSYRFGFVTFATASEAQSAIGVTHKIGDKLVAGEKYVGGPPRVRNGSRPVARVEGRPTNSAIVVPDEQKVYVAAVPDGAVEDELRTEFSRFGRVIDVRFFPPKPGRNVRFGYVGFATKEDADQCVGVTCRVHGQLVTAEKFVSRHNRKTAGPDVSESGQIKLYGIPEVASKDDVWKALNSLLPQQLKFMKMNVINGHFDGTAVVWFHRDEDAERFLSKRSIDILRRRVFIERHGQMEPPRTVSSAARADDETEYKPRGLRVHNAPQGGKAPSAPVSFASHCVFSAQQHLYDR